MKNYSSRELIQLLKADGWYEVKIRGSHHHFKHDLKQGKITVPHPKKSFPMNTLKSIVECAGLELK